MALVPLVPKVAVFPEKLTADVLLELHVVEFVTSLPFNAAVNAALVPDVKVVPLGEVIVKVCELLPVVLPVMVP